MAGDEFRIIDALRSRGERIARAVLISIEGGSSRRLGAALWVAADGSTWGGITLGGCIEAWVAARAREVLAGGTPGLMRIALAGEAEIDPRLGCAGEAEIQIEVVDFADQHDRVVAVYYAMRRECDDGRAAVAALSRTGARVTVVLGGKPDARLPAPVYLAARRMLVARSPRVLTAEGGGEWLLELFRPCPLLLVFGVGPVAVALTSFAASTGFRVWVMDARAENLSAARFPDAERLVLVDPHYTVDTLPWNADSYAVVTSHNPADEVPVIAHAVGTEVAFVGFVASRERGSRVLRHLADMGVPQECLGRVRVPIGLDIGAESPAEIAVSILAEVISVRSARQRADMPRTGAPASLTLARA